MSTIKVNNITDEVGTGGPTFPQGLTITGTLSATTLIGTLASSNLTGALPALDGSALTNLPAAGITQSARSNATNGYVTLSNGLIFQWNRWSSTHGTKNFPIAFPTICLGFAVAQNTGWYEAPCASVLSASQYETHNVRFGNNASRVWQANMYAIGY